MESIPSSFGGSLTTYGGNKIKANYLLEFITFPILTGDLYSMGLNLGFRDQILEDGFGLKYWPIIDSSSDLINTKAPNIRTPGYDCRRAPRSLKGSSPFLIYPDAGAVEYTHLRVTDSDGDEATPNSFLWALSDALRKDEIHYIEFDLADAVSDIEILSTAVLDVNGYILDGYSQFSSSIPGPPISGAEELTPATLAINLENTGGIINCFEINKDATESIIQGFRIQKFNGTGIYNEADNLKIYGNEIGLLPSNIASGNLSSGISSEDAEGVIIGGMEHFQRNVIAGNGSDEDGEEANIALKSGRTIEIYGNLIGIANDGINEITGGSITKYGVFAKSDANKIGSHLINGSNFIGKNDFGICLQESDSSEIYNNWIGIGIDGITELDNTNAGILLENANRNLIGNITPGYGNHIANNGSGINLGAEGGVSQYNSFLRNSIYNNNAQGIDLNGDGVVLANDSLLNLSGQNHEIDFPQLLYSLTCDAENTKTGYQLNLPVGSDCRVEFFTIDAPDATNGEGKTFIGHHDVTLVATPEQFVFDHGEVIPESTNITATVTRINSGNTSEFGNNLVVARAGDASFSMDDFCPDSLGISVIIGEEDGYFSFTTPFPGDGATLDSLTGVLTGGVQGSSYEIFRNVDECDNNDTIIVSVLDLDPSFTYPDFCPGTTGTPSSITEAGGTFSFLDDLADGASINSTTCAITGGVEGTTYNVIYDLNQCEFRDTVAVTVIPTDESFTMNDFCIPDSEVASPETLGGSFQFAPDPADGASIDAASGQIMDAIEGTTYYIEYEVGVCSEVDTVAIEAIFTDERFSFADFCPGTDGTPVIIGEAGGEFSFQSPEPVDGASIDDITGTISDGFEGANYTVIYTVGVCDDKDTVTVEVIPTDESFSFDDFCAVDSGFPTAIATPGGDFRFAPDPGDGAVLDISTGELSGTTEGSSYSIEYTVGVCSEKDTLTVSIIEADERFNMSDFCPGTEGIAVIEGDEGGTFSFLPPPPLDGATLDAVTGRLSDAVEGETYTIIYTVGVCNDKDTVEVYVLPTDESFSFDDLCPGEVGLPYDIASPGGIFSLAPDLGDGATIDAVTGEFEDGIEGETYTIQYLVGACYETDSVTIVVESTDEGFTLDDFCAETSDPAVPNTPGGTYQFAPDLFDGAIINPSTGVIDNAIEGTEYAVEYEVGSCGEVDTNYVQVIETDESFEFDDFCPGTDGVPVITGDEGGTFSFLAPAPVDGASIDPITGIVSDGVESTSYTIIYTVGVCNDADTNTATVINVDETFSFDDFCPSSIGVPSDIATPGGSFYLTPDPLDGAEIDLTTGEITDAVEGNTYYIEYIVGLCSESSIEEATVIPADESFSLDDFCASTSLPASVATPGGTFSFAPDLLDGASINPVNGVISDGIEGTEYTVEYEVGTCDEVDTVLVNVIETDESFVFNDFCPGTEGVPVITGDEGGEFSFLAPVPLDGASIDPITGIVSDGIEGTSYTIIYRVGVCDDRDTATALVIPTDESFTFDDICPNTAGLPTDVMTPGGTFFLAPDLLDGAAIDGLTGELTNGIEGETYAVAYTVGECFEEDTVRVHIIETDESFSIDEFCPNVDSEVARTITPGGVFEFAPDLMDGSTIDPLTGQISNGIEGTSYQDEYTVGACAEQDTIVVTVISTDESFVFDNFCAKFVGIPTDIATEGGTFSFAPDLMDGSTIDPISGYISDATPGTNYTIEYTVGVCSERDSVVTTALISEIADFTLDNFCAGDESEAEITGTPGGVFTFNPIPADDAIIDELTGSITNSDGNNYTVQYRTSGTEFACPDTITKMVTVFTLPVINELKSTQNLYCPQDELLMMEADITADESTVYWRKYSETDPILDSGIVYLPTDLDVGENNYFVQIRDINGCESEFQDIIIYLSDTAGMQAGDDVEICLGKSADLSAYGGVSYEWEAGGGLSNIYSSNPSVFTLQQHDYIVRIKNEDECVVSDTLSLTFSPENECTIYVVNAFSPNGDGKNDTWYIDNLINHLPNTVYIYNRWGDKILEFSNYDNINVIWDGKDKTGTLLPPNTYYYVVEVNSELSEAGWVQIVY